MTVFFHKKRIGQKLNERLEKMTEQKDDQSSEDWEDKGSQKNWAWMAMLICAKSISLCTNIYLFFSFFFHSCRDKFQETTENKMYWDSAWYATHSSRGENKICWCQDFFSGVGGGRGGGRRGREGIIRKLLAWQQFRWILLLLSFCFLGFFFF